MIDDSLVAQYERDGVCVVPEVLAPDRVRALRQELDNAVQEDLKNRPDVFDSGMVHNCLFRGPAMASVLDEPSMAAYLDVVLAPSCILYAYQSSSLPPSGGNYGTRVHVDSPRFIDGYTTNVGVIFPLDDFTQENGGTLYLPGSHKQAEIPDDAAFHAHCKQLVCSAGDMIVFNARLAHSAGQNSTATTRHALTLNFCRCYMRQRFDFPRMISPEQLSTLGETGKRLIGWNVRVPTSLDEFYLPPEQRLYKPGQE